jgi:hypothetical protein
MAFIDCTEQQISIPVDKERKKYVLFSKEKETYCKESAYG